MAPQRLSRAESKVRTRTRLLAAAARVFRTRGYRSATVEEIASEAGYTIGALYSNFAAKEDLLLALLEREIGSIIERIAAVADEAKDAGAKLRRGALEWVAILDEQPELYVLLIEFWTLWVRDPRLRPEHAERFAALRQAVGDLIAGEIGRTGASLRIPPEQVGAAVVALADGLALQRLADPKATPDDLLASLLEALIPALINDAARESPPASR
jgi:AcrR family transcriptional regulator